MDELILILVLILYYLLREVQQNIRGKKMDIYEIVKLPYENAAQKMYNFIRMFR